MRRCELYIPGRDNMFVCVCVCAVWLGTFFHAVLKYVQILVTEQKKVLLSHQRKRRYFDCQVISLVILILLVLWCTKVNIITQL